MPGGTWPDGPLQDTPPPPPELLLVQQVSRTFRDACEARGLSIREAAQQAEISDTAVYNVLNGLTWCDLPTIARIERNFRIKLWVSQQDTLGPD